tara:strand:- start:358 stop:1056 length:699 start_codon:yes stop_codon:yes gene_type:complete
MKYNIIYNQYGLLKYNEMNRANEIDFIDAILLHWIYTTIEEWQSIEQKEINEKLYYWIAYDKFLEELPSIGIATKDGISKRLKKGLIKQKMLLKFEDKKDNHKTYFHLTPIGQQTVTLRTDDRNHIGAPSVNLSDSNPDNSITINKKTKDERELTHFEYFITSFPNEYEKWKNKYSKKLLHPTDFKDGFNNKMEIKNFPMNKKIVPRLNEYTRQWIRNLEPYTKPAYLRTIN